MKKRSLLIAGFLFGLMLFSCKDEEVSPEDSSPVETNDGEDDSTVLSVQGKLDDGETPFEIYKEDSSLLDSLYGKSYEGGLIVFLNTTDGSGLIATENDIDTSYAQWGCLNTVLGKNIFVGNDPFNGSAMFQFVTYAINENIGGGLSNTEQINEACLVSAALICDAYVENDYDDWYMPSRYEMVEVSKSLAKTHELRDSYWTSTQENTQMSSAKVYVVYTEDHSSNLQPKADKIGRGLRAVRQF